MSRVSKLRPILTSRLGLRKAWPPAYSMLSRFASTLSLSYELHKPSNHSSDSSPPLIFLHGLFGSKKNNRSISRILARDLGRPVYALDLRNHGESPHDRRHDYLSMAEDVERFLNEQQLRGSTLIGHSMGAKTAMTVALQSPDLISSLVAVDNAPTSVPLTNDFAKYIRGMKQIEESAVSRQAEADEILQKYEESRHIRQFLLANLYRPNGNAPHNFRIPLDTLADALGSLGIFPFNDPDSIKFRKPALFIRGTKSDYVPDDVLPLIRQFFPLFKLENIEAGHWLISEQPEAFRQAVVNFLRVNE